MKSCLFNPEPCVLVVDDHAISRQHTVQALLSVTRLVHQAGNGAEAMVCSLRLLPDLIFLDIRLPDTCGLSLLKRIRQAWPRGKPHPAIVILSGDDSDLVKQKAEQSEVNAILIKPVPFYEIRNIAVRLLHLEQGVEEGSALLKAEGPQAGLRELFLTELENRVPQLDRKISSLDWISATDLTHQLIASCALCQERNLEFHCRQLHQRLSTKSPARRVAHAYYSFLKAVDHLRIELQT